MQYCYIMLTIYSCSRYRKLVTAVLTAGTAFHTVLYTEYAMPPHMQGSKHVFSDIQTSYRSWVDRTIWRLPPDKDGNDEKVVNEQSKPPQ